MSDENIKEETAADDQVPVNEAEQLRQELGEAKDKHIRLFAEFDNMRKRHQREREELIDFIKENKMHASIQEIIESGEDFSVKNCSLRDTTSSNSLWPLTWSSYCFFTEE